jgi:hypothetical protein
MPYQRVEMRGEMNMSMGGRPIGGGRNRKRRGRPLESRK